MPYGQKWVDGGGGYIISPRSEIADIDSESSAKENLRDLALFCECGVLLWLVRAQHRIITKANAKEHLGEFIYLSIAKDNVVTSRAGMH